MWDMLQLDAHRAIPDTSVCGAGSFAKGSRACALAVAIRVANAHAPGLALTQLQIFLAIAADEGARLGEISARVDQNMANVSRGVAILTAAGHPGSRKRGYGLVTLFGDAADGRVRRAALSDAGRRLLAQINASHPP